MIKGCYTRARDRPPKKEQAVLQAEGTEWSTAFQACQAYSMGDET